MKYAITSGQPNRLKIHRLFEHALVLEPEAQALLREAERDGHQLRCLCSGHPSSTLHTRGGKSGAQHPYRAKDNEHEHVPGCVHGDSSRIADVYRAPAGSISARDGVITVDFDLLFPREQESSDGMGEWQGSPPDYGAALRSLMWLLIVQSGLHVSGPECHLADPWETLLRGAKSIIVGRIGGAITLADLLLTEVDAGQKWKGNRNYAKLCRAAETTKRVLVACHLPGLARDRQDRDVVDLAPVLDVMADVHRSLLGRALGQSPFAWQRHRAKHPVLAFGSASAKHPKRGRANAAMNQFILLPIGPGLIPLPEQRHIEEFARSLETGMVFCVGPGDDPLIAMRSRLWPWKKWSIGEQL